VEERIVYMAMRTDQEIFNLVADHLLKQGRKSQTADALQCFYRGPDGLKCAIGVLIPDEFYGPRFEDTSSVENLLEQEPVLRALLFEGADTIEKMDRRDELLASLQSIHDCFEVDTWKTKLDKLARELGLAPFEGRS
jgi:hypothetical protein